MFVQMMSCEKTIHYNFNSRVAGLMISKYLVLRIMPNDDDWLQARHYLNEMQISTFGC